MTMNWIGMDTRTQEARRRKAKEIRICRYYLEVAKKSGLSEKSTSVRYWRHTLAEWRATPLFVIAGGEQTPLSD